jgi:AcrR family transcriptional regulator
VAQRARISKRTFYHRFPDKAALFAAVVRRIIEELRPPAGTPLYKGGSLEEVLRRLARLLLHAVLMPMALSLNRLMVAEAQRFPELGAIVALEGGRGEVVGQIAAMLEREAREGALTIDRPVFAAEQFIQLVVGLPQRRALGLGEPMTEAELDAWADDCVNLFLNGCRFWRSVHPDRGPVRSGGREIARQTPPGRAQPAMVFRHVIAAAQPGDLLPTALLERPG